MIYDCPTCAAALIYNPESGKLECHSCNNTYDVATLKELKKMTDFEKSDVATENLSNKRGTMECNIYSCTACGAELAVNGVESSTFCSYCGQPTIVFSRVSSTVKPKYIIPFTVTKEQAVTSIRNHLKKGFFVPKEIRNFEIERVRGIYIPFWIYDIDYSDRLYLEGTVREGKRDVTKYYYREGNCSFHNITLDASKQLNDESSQRLEPYDMTSLTSFDIGYLTGFYADCYDASLEALNELALERAKTLFDEEVIKTVNANNVEIIRSNTKRSVTKSEYAMFPAWFLTFRHNDEPYTILVNGQTNKVIGAVPYNKIKATICFGVIGIIASILASLLVYGLIKSEMEDIGELIFALIGWGIINYKLGSNNFKKVRTSIDLSKLKTTNNYVKDRVGGN